MSDLMIIALVMSGYLYLAGCALALAVPNTRLWLVPLWPIAIGAYVIVIGAMGFIWLLVRARMFAQFVFKYSRSL